jgi:alpha-L-rhamnosidase
MEYAKRARGKVEDEFIQPLAFGAVGDWMYRYLAGLNPVEPGYRRTKLQPRPGGGFFSARATHESLHGTHACGWRIEAGTLHVDGSVPANTTATLVLPGDRRTDVPPDHHTFEGPYRHS